MPEWGCLCWSKQKQNINMDFNFFTVKFVWIELINWNKNSYKKQSSSKKKRQNTQLSHEQKKIRHPIGK